jgi:hypothetical protein
MRGNKLSVDRTKKEAQRDLKMAKGGKTPMYKQQAAGLAKAGQTGKRETSAPGAKFARGGGDSGSGRSSDEKPFRGGFAKPAKAGATGPC